MPPIADVLEDLLPLLKPTGPEWHEGVAVLEVAERVQLVELAANPKIRRCLLGRLSDTVALIDPGEADALTRVLRAHGETPKLVKGVEP
jgi:hypothetical protein